MINKKIQCQTQRSVVSQKPREKKKCFKKEGVGSSVEYRKINRKVIDDLDE